MKKLYTAPLLTIVSINVESGYANSIHTSASQSIDMSAIFGESSNSLSEARSVSTGWVKDNDDAFWGGNTYSTEI